MKGSIMRLLAKVVEIKRKKIMSRLETLYNRYERLVAKGYIHTDKADRYLVVLYAIKDEITKVQAENRRKNAEFSNFLKSTAGLNGSQILIIYGKKNY